jgi:hypothetical protein
MSNLTVFLAVLAIPVIGGVLSWFTVLAAKRLGLG